MERLVCVASLAIWDGLGSERKQRNERKRGWVNVGARVSRDGRRRATILAGSLLLHVGLLAWLALPMPPMLQTLPAEDLPIMTVDLLRPEREEQPKPRLAPSASATSAPSPVLPFEVRQPARPVPPGVPTLNAPVAPPAATRPGTAIRPAPLPGEGAGDLRTALRNSPTGCISADAVGLNRREREKCDERFGAAKAKGDPTMAMDPGKRRALDAQAAGQEAYRRYLEAPMGPGVDHRSRNHPGTMKEIPFVLGAEQDGLGRPRAGVVDQIRREKDREDRARKFLDLQKKAGN